jgi:hypothetical protein
LVLCAQAGHDARVLDAAAQAGLAVTKSLVVVPRTAKAALFAVHTIAATVGHPSPPSISSLTVRDRAGARTPEFRQLRAAMGLPP